MALTLAALREALIDALGLLEIDQMIPTESLNRSVNAGLRRFSREREWPWLMDYTTVSLLPEDDEYPLPADVARIVVASIDGEEVYASSPRDMIRSFGTKGRPTSFYIREGNVRLAPSPQVPETLSIVYVRPENTLADDGDTALTPDQYEDIVVTYAAVHQATRLKDQQLISTLEMVRKQLLESVTRDVIKTTKAPPIQTRSDVI